jgi:hypothetical protein
MANSIKIFFEPRLIHDVVNIFWQSGRNNISGRTYRSHLGYFGRWNENRTDLIFAMSLKVANPKEATVTALSLSRALSPEHFANVPDS